MSDLVNDFFRRFYPPDLDRNKFEPDWLPGGSTGFRYPGRDNFPAMECADGFSMSVQGHFGAYSTPRDDYAESYSAVEVYCLSEPEPLLNDHDNERRRAFGFDTTEQRAGIDQPSAYVPIAVIEAIVAKHGGLKP